MKQIRPYTTPYQTSGSCIKKRKSSLRDTAIELSGKRSFTAFSSLALFVLFFISINTAAHAQSCPTSGSHDQTANENTYYPGTQATVSAGATSITLGPAGTGTNFANTPIAAGDIVLIIQMQGAQINSANSNLYGSGVTTPVQVQGSGFTSTNLKVGKMEFAVAANGVPVATGGTLNLVAGTTNSYTYSAFGTYGQFTYQIIRVPSYYDIKLKNPGVTTPLWNGSTGGVTVINAINQLDFNSKTINAAGAGFRGGAARKLTGAAGTNNTDYVTMSTVNANGSKAEGIAGTPRYVNDNGSLLNTGTEGYPNGSYARGAPGNAGGGATDYDPVSNDQNSGGGGGGNGGSGGKGGWGWNLSGPSGGMGGLSFNLASSPYTAYHSPSRLIMGGGGGAATTNNGTGTPSGGFASSGSAGGGIVIIGALAIIGTGTVDASGLDGNSTVTIDASGGGGAGGSILIYANSGQSGITAIANGGNGGSNNPGSQGATQHGPGGGGGGGVIYSNGLLNVASSVAAGAGGISTGSTKTDNFGATGGSVGKLTQTFPFSQLPPNMQICQSTVLPITLLDFNASYVASDNVLVSWSTSREINSSYFEVERSYDGSDFTAIGQVTANASSDNIQNYNYNDFLGSVNSSVLYYRLKMVDINGKFSYSNIIPVRLDQPEAKIGIYPNPAQDNAVLSVFAEKQTVASMRLIDVGGRQIRYKSFTINSGNNSIMIDQLGSLPTGVYVVQVIFNNTLYNQKLIKK